MQQPIKIGDQYVLTPVERDEIKAIARERSASNRKANVRDAGIGPSSGVFKDMVGAAGEWAFAKLTNTAFDSSVSPRSYLQGEDGAGDMTYRDCVIDVKSTHYKTGKLVVVPWKGESAKQIVYALMIMMDRNGPTFEFRGFADPELVQGFSTDLGHGPTFAVPQSRLREWWAIAGFQEVCQPHGILACLDCPDPFIPESIVAAAALEF